MNILYLSADRGIPIRGHKGASVHVRELTAAFHAQGHQVTILTARAGSRKGVAPQARLVAVAPAAKETEIVLNETLANETLAKERQAQAYADALFEKGLAEIEQGDYAFIYERYSLWSDVGARLSAATGLPLVLEVNAPLRLETVLYRQLVDEETAVRIEKTQFTAADHLIVVSTWLADYAAERGAPREHIHILPNAVDPQQFHPAVRGGKIRNFYGLHDKIVVGFVGRPRPWHDLQTLLSAVASLHQADERYHLLLVGQMPDDIPAQLAAHGLENAATVTNAIPHNQVPAHIAAMDIAVSPHRALADFYYSPLKLFEYLACGVPTVAANVGQQGDIICPAETGYLYPAGNEHVLAAYMRKFSDEPETARRIAWQGATYVLQNHTWAQNAQAVVNLVIGNQESGGSGDLNSQSPTLPILDNKLRQRLYRATRPDLVHSFFSKELPMFGRHGGERLKHVTEIELFKYKPNRRCVLGYRLNGRLRHSHTKTTHEIIGKVFRDDRGERLHALQDALWHNGFADDSPDNIHVPRAIAYLSKMRMQVQEKAPGKTLNELVQTTPIDGYMSRCAHGLAKLHCTDLAGWLEEHSDFQLKSYTIDHELRQLARFTENLCGYRPDLAKDAHYLHQALVAWGKRLPQTRTAVPIHRDFYYSQLLVAGNRLTLIDFDLLALGDPALDVANFTAHLAFMGIDHLDDIDALAAAADLFKISYAWPKFVDETFWERVTFYEAATFFRLLQVIAPRPGLAHLFDPMLERTRQMLAVMA